jgi:uncharacterized cupin superfamily protein
MSPRRVVTGFDAKGRSVVVSDGPAPVVTTSEHLPGLELHRMWSQDESPPVVGRPEVDGSGAFPLTPPAGGIRFIYTHRPPGAGADPDDEPVSGSVETAEGTLDPRSFGMHATASIDFSVVLSGQVALVLDGGEEVVLGPGDVLVQNGTMHRWRVVGDEPCRRVSVLIGAEPADGPESHSAHAGAPVSATTRTAAAPR